MDAGQEASHRHTLIFKSNLKVINSNASSLVPESMVLGNTVTSVSPVLEGERVAEVSIQVCYRVIIFIVFMTC